MNGRMMNYRASMDAQKPIMPSELPNIRIDYKGLVKYAKKKGVRVIELADSEKNRFIKK